MAANGEILEDGSSVAARRNPVRPELWQAVFDACPGMIVVSDERHRILRANTAVAARADRPETQLCGTDIHEALCRDDHDRQDCPFLPPTDPAQAREAARYREIWDGHFEIISRPLADGRDGPPAWMHVLRDVTQHRRAEEQLREAHDQLEVMIRSISAILLCVDGSGRVTEWNAAAESAFGVPKDRALGRLLLGCGVRWDADRVRDAAAECAFAGNPVRLDEVRFRRRDGKDGLLSMTLNPMKSKRRRYCGILILARDITERKFLESQLAQAQKLEAIGQLAAGVAHEINTPMQYVGDNLRFLSDSFAGLVELHRRYRKLLAAAEAGRADEELVADVRAAAADLDEDYLLSEVPAATRQSIEGLDQVTRIVQAMREFSHPGGEEKAAADINRAIASTLTVCRNEWKYVAEVETDFDPDLPPVPCLPGELNQAILNLIINAAHAIEDAAGGRPTAKGTITLRTRRQGPWAEIRVTDSGTGIPDEIRSRIFNPFFTTKQVGRGTGQGLAIAHAVIVDRHGGTLSFETEMGRGTTFVVRLPLQPQADQEAERLSEELVDVE
jgi:PAS domain S-box-containing protein